jgi:hypothetical protein
MNQKTMNRDSQFEMEKNGFYSCIDFAIVSRQPESAPSWNESVRVEVLE